MKLVCELCGGALLVDAGGQEATCKNCGLCYPMAALREKLGLGKAEQPKIPEMPAEGDVFAKPYRIVLERVKNPSIGNKVTCILIRDGRPRPLADDAAFWWDTDEKRFEIPIYIAKGDRKRFEGVLTGVPDGKDLHIVLDVDPNVKMLAVIKECNNSTIHLEERPGATDNWTHGQY